MFSPPVDLWYNVKPQEESLFHVHYKFSCSHIKTGLLLTVGELQHLVDDSGLVLGDPHVLQDLDHHLQHTVTIHHQTT